MIKKHMRLLIITSAAILLPILAGLLLWNRLPAQMPTHWNAAGEIDGWSSKPFAVFGLPLLLLGIHWICALATAADPKKANHSEKVLHLIFWLVPVLSILLHGATYAAALGMTVKMELITSVSMGLILTIIGNYLPKCKQNYTIGIKLPWTLNSEENWNRTHRFAGRLWVVCGFGIILVSFLGSFLLSLCLFLVMPLAPVVYSYLLFRKGI